MKHLKVSAKLLLGFGIVAALTVTISIVGMLSLQKMDTSYSDGIKQHGYPLETMGRALTHLQGIRIGVRDAILNRDDAALLSQVDADTKADIQEFETLIAEFRQVLVTEEGVALYDEAMGEFDGIYKPMVLKVLEDVKNSDMTDEALLEQLNIAASATSDMVTNFNILMTLKHGLLENIDIENTALGNRLLIISLIIGIISAALAVFLGLFLARLISKPLAVFSAFMNKAGETGDLSLSPEDTEIIRVTSSRRDEIGQIIKNAASFVKHVTTIAEELEALSHGNLTVDIEALSKDDTLGMSLLNMEDGLNKMFREVSTSTTEVSSGAKQVADGSQSLAQGATEQAAAIQQLSASIGDITEKTKENASTADETSKLSELIMDNAVKGSKQMDEMMTAVKDINDASQSISKIIKTIDDIAFQTNILALNAAVEAARAGQHGKGFAVVAEEVRNLAAKSAEAAKETGVMIQNTMDKAEFGSCIAGETATSLKEIVDGINKSSQLIEAIARSSEEQVLGISQINTGIDQVAQVIQQNSATAQESAAASEQMSSQSTMLQELISAFKLKDEEYDLLEANEVKTDPDHLTFDINNFKRSA